MFFCIQQQIQGLCHKLCSQQHRQVGHWLDEWGQVWEQDQCPALPYDHVDLWELPWGHGGDRQQVHQEHYKIQDTRYKMYI